MRKSRNKQFGRRYDNPNWRPNRIIVDGDELVPQGTRLTNRGHNPTKPYMFIESIRGARPDCDHFVPRGQHFAKHNQSGETMCLRCYRKRENISEEIPDDAI